ncbi:MAG: pseudouridine synthase [Patescibacteria group bacterium]
MRINKFIALSGVASRRTADQLIRQGRVERNGQVVTELGVQVDPTADTITVDGRSLQPVDSYTYLALHKPRGYVCTHARFDGEQSVFTLLPARYRHLKMSGRLDKDSEGLLILSDDGGFIQQLGHPRYAKAKEYQVVVTRALSSGALAQLRRGVRLDEGVAQVDEIRMVNPTTYTIRIHQGWKRQIRRMMEAVGARVVRLVRTRVGPYALGSLPPGEYKEIKKPSTA